MSQSSDPNKPPKPDPRPSGEDSNDAPAIPPSSWAKRTGFRPRFSGETNASDSAQIVRPPVNGTAPAVVPVVKEVKKKGEGEGGGGRLPPKAGGNNVGAVETPVAPPARVVRIDDVENALPRTDDDEFVSRQGHMKYELRDSPGLVPIGFYGFQHYLSMLGSLVLIPLVIVPAMGGDHEDMSKVVSTVLFVSGMTTLLQAYFGSRLPLIQGPSFVFLAPALAIIKSPEFLGLNGNVNWIANPPKHWRIYAYIAISWVIKEFYGLCACDLHLFRDISQISYELFEDDDNK